VQQLKDITMNNILKMKNVVQPYIWGSRHALADFLGDTSSPDSPKAELWMGAHPKAPSRVWLNNTWERLDTLIQTDTRNILGESGIKRFENQLPYLLKVLAADQPLSIQAHPTRQQARKGFEKEEALGIPLSDGHRNYKDRNHKPESICALTPFWGVCGFRHPGDMLPLLRAVLPDNHPDAKKLLEPLTTGLGLRVFFERLVNMPATLREHLVGVIMDAAKPLAERDKAFEWVLTLHEHYPNDIGVISPLILNLFCLEPEEALFLPAGQLHAYFRGMGIEIMANSDNVLRGGLTQKHVDVSELINVLDFSPATVEPLKATIFGPCGCEYRYPSPAEEFILTRLDINPETTYTSPVSSRQSAEILLCTRGEAIIYAEADEEIHMSRGRSVFVPYGVQSYAVMGDATVYKAAVQ
jgi:mannose-6-phosphate isomerase